MFSNKIYHPSRHLFIGLTIIFLLISFNMLNAGAPDTLWTKTFGGSNDDRGHSLQQTSDGGYIIMGNTISYGVGNSDVWLIKTDASGDTLWTKTFGGNDNEYGKCVQQTSDGGYIIVGFTKSFGAGKYDVLLIKTDASGDTLWTKTFGGSDYDKGYYVQQIPDGSYVITGHTKSYGAGNYDVWLIKTDASGDTLWTKTFGGTNNDESYSVRQTIDSGYIIAGNTKSYGAGNTDVWLIKTDASGDTLWTKTFGGSSYDNGYCVQQIPDGSYIITGHTQSYGVGNYDVWLIKTDASGGTLWTKTFGGNSNDESYSVQQTTDSGYIITGNTQSYGAGNTDVWLIKTDSLGNKIWTNTFGGSRYDYGYSVKQTSDYGYIVTGYTGSYGAGSFDSWLIRIESHIPSPPTDLRTIAGDQEVTLLWSPNTESDLHKYNIYRDISSPADILIDSVVVYSVSDTTYLDLELTNGQIYYYRITAVDSDGNESKFSSEVNAIPVSKEIALTDTTHNFGDVQIDSISYWVFYIKNIGNDTLNFSNITNSLTVYSLSDTSGQINPSDSLEITISFNPSVIKTYFDTLRIYSNDSDPEDSLKFIYLLGAGVDTIAPEIPRNLEVIDSLQSITLKWITNTEVDLSYYNIYRSDSSNFTPDSIYFKGKVFFPDTTFIDSLIQNNVTYYYKLTAVDTAENESQPSQYVQTTAIYIDVWDVSFQQRKDGSELVDIYYSFSGHDKTHYQSLPLLSINDGNTWNEILSISGDIGTQVLPDSSRHFIWNLKEEIPDIYYENAKIKIIVSTTSSKGKMVPLGEGELKLERERYP